MRGHQLLLHVAGDLLAVALGEDGLGREAVGAHPERARLGGHVLGEELDAGLGRGVGDRRPRVGPARGGGGHGHDRAAPARLHAGQEALEGEEGGREVHVDRAAPVVLAQLLGGARPHRAAARVGHEHVDRAEPRLHLLAHALDRVQAREVGRDRRRRAAAVGDARADGLERVAVAPVDRHARALLREERRDGRADAARAAGDQGGASLEPVHRRNLPAATGRHARLRRARAGAPPRRRRRRR